MQIIPAIDIKNGKCVRLTQGDFAKEKIYSDDPIAVAQQWEKYGAKTIHVVDLDGAKTGVSKNLQVIKKIVKSIAIPIQVGGGIRNIETVKQLLKLGVSKIILGTIVLDDIEKIKKIATDFPTKVAVALDSKNGKLMTNGWVKQSNKNMYSVVKQLEKIGITIFIFTDITRDGTLTEPNFKEVTKLIKIVSGEIIVSGGISNIEQLKKLESLGIKKAIIGKALYERKINLKEVQNVN
jgi:phosphoribosylformimino-5-aminoimidazole carboxamide ribotide isomerase